MRYIMALLLFLSPLSARIEWVPAQGAVLTWASGDTLCVGRYAVGQPWEFLGCGDSGFTDPVPVSGSIYTLSPSGGGDVLATIPLVSRSYIPFVSADGASPYPAP